MADKLIIREEARAKVNLSLHVIGQRMDGYHLLDSLVIFTEIGDTIEVSESNEISLSIEGPFASALKETKSNLVLDAARLIQNTNNPVGANIKLIKRLPVASGIGGGSADAAATIRALCKLWGQTIPSTELLITLGADLPVCMSSELTQMTGIGEKLTRIGPAPMLDMLLVNPGISVPTERVFKGLESKYNPGLESKMPDPFDTDSWIDWLVRQRNDLELPAVNLAPDIAKVLASLNDASGCRLARMSGSGATCFAIFSDQNARDEAAKSLSRKHPNWWMAPTNVAPMQ